MQYNDYDSPWKDILENYFLEFLDFFFPEVGNAIDRNNNYEFLDKEFQQVVKEAEHGRKLTDKLVKVWQNGNEVWLLVHIEIQSFRDSEFAKRMFVYNYRIFDRYDRPVVSLALLTDNNRKWRPNSFEYGLWGSRTAIQFPVAKLMDWHERRNELKKSTNPFAVCTLAQLKAHDTANSPDDRRQWKLRLIRRLYEKGYARQDILNIFRFIDWIMMLPKKLEENFWQELRQYEEEKKMQYITSVERIGIEKGIQQGMQQGMEKGKREGYIEVIETVLTLKFGTKGLRLLPLIHKVKDLAILEVIKETVKISNDLAEIETRIKEALNTGSDS
jgi:flagellar biosynthesis/type III secretory pathway protein FliH